MIRAVCAPRPFEPFFILSISVHDTFPFSNRICSVSSGMCGFAPAVPSDHGEVNSDILRLCERLICEIGRRPIYSQYYSNIQVTCLLALPVHIDDPYIRTIIHCPSTQLTPAYLHAFHFPKSRISAANVLTVVKQPQYPSISPCRMEHA